MTATELKPLPRQPDPQGTPALEPASRPCATTVYYDGACPLCTLEIGHYRRQAGAESLTFVDVSRQEALDGTDLSRPQALQRFHIRKADGTLLSGAAAFVEIWRQLPRWAWAARLASLPGAVPLLEICYRGFLHVRPLLSRAVGRLRRDKHAARDG